MFNKINRTLFILISGWGSLNAQVKSNAVTLSVVLQQSELLFPLTQQKEIYSQIRNENTSSAFWQLLPQTNMVGQAAHQSEVTSFSMPGIPSGLGQKKDNGNIGIESKLSVSSLGKIGKLVNQENSQLEVNQLQTDVELQRFKERMIQLYGGIVYLNETKKLIKNRLNDIQQRIKKMNVEVEQGAVNQKNQLNFETDLLQLIEQYQQTQASFESALSQLNLFTQQKYDTSSIFLWDEVMISLNSSVRPEIKLLDAQINLLSTRTSVNKMDMLPNLYVFGQGYYGRPGYNFLNTKFRTYGIAGLGLSWSMNNFITVSKTNKVMALNQELLRHKKEEANQMLESQTIQKMHEYESYVALLKTDNDIIERRKKIVNLAQVQFENGFITSTELLTELNNLQAAESNKNLHQVQKNLTALLYNQLKGN